MNLILEKQGYWVYITAPYNAGFIKHLKQFPGRQWVPKPVKKWRVPVELLDWIYFESYYPGPEFILQGDWTIPDVDQEYLEGLYPYQQDAIKHLARNAYTGLLSFEMGLGKTPTSIRAMLSAKVKRLLIVCPAVVRINWENELQRWGWTGTIGICDKGKDLPDAEAIITSYELLKHFQKQEFDGIIFDEAHYLKNGKAGRTKNARALRLRNLGKPAIALSATPITTEPKDIHSITDILWPDRFGSFWQFVNRYCNVEANDYGTTIQGVNASYSDELGMRMRHIAVRVTKHEVRDLLPPSIVQTLRVRDNSRWGHAGGFQAALQSGADREQLRTHCERVGQRKHRRALELAKELRLGGTTHICVLTHLRKSAEELASKFPDATLITGDMPPKDRMAAIKLAEASPTSTLVCTMHSVGIGIDLTKFTGAIFAELYWQPAVIIQALGRFSRLSGKDPSTCYLLVLEGSIDEPIASALRRRLKDQAELYKNGLSEEKMLEGMAMSEEDVILELREAAANAVEEEYW